MIAQSQHSRGIRADEVSRDHVAGGARAGQKDAIGSVAGNDIAADGIRRRAAHGDSVICVADDQFAGNIGADVIALNDILTGGRAIQENAADSVAGDEVAGVAGPANQVSAAPVNHDSVVVVAQRAGAGCIDADVIALHHIAARVVNVNAGVVAAGNHIAVAGLAPANPVARTFHPDAVAAVAPGKGAGRVRANEVALNDI